MSIIHIVDLDGTFIPEDSIIESDTGKIKYTENTIECMTRSDIVGRNRKKASIIRRLTTVHQIDNIPYMIFFASRNMDHVLFNAPDSSQKEKSDNAWRFISACKKTPILSQILSSRKELGQIQSMKSHGKKYKAIMNLCIVIQI